MVLFASMPLLLLGEGGAGPRFLYGADVSALAVFEENGATYRDAKGRRGDALEILEKAGMNLFRLRLFVDPDDEGIVTNDLAYTLKLARRIDALGAQWLLDIHYSDTWADPGKQYKPKAWASLDFDALRAEVARYTAEVLQRFDEAGVPPDYVQLGNEITNGMLWPDGRVEYSAGDETTAWERFAALQRAAHDGLVRAFPEAAQRPRKILHIESTGNLPRTRWYLEHFMKAGIPFDLVGFSYYPEWHGTLEDLAATLGLAAELTKKPVVVAEVAYPWKDDPHWDGVANLAYPLTPEGQTAFLQAIHHVLEAVPEERGVGLFWWYPEAVLNPAMHVWLGGSCGLFDDRGRLLPAATSLDF